MDSGYATLTLIATETIGTSSSTRTVSVKMSQSGTEAIIEQGPKIPFQTVANNTVTTAFRNAGLQVRARVTPFTVQQERAVRLSLTVEDAHVLQQVDMPVRLTKVPMIDVTRLIGTFVMENHVERPLGRYRRRGVASNDWRVSGRLDWNELPEARGAAESFKRVNFLVSVGDPARALDEFESQMEFFPGSDSAAAEMTRGRQAPVETLANNTSTISYKDSGTSLRIVWSTAPELLATSTQFVTFSDTSDAAQLYENGFSSGLIALNPQGFARPLLVSDVVTAEGRTSLTVERFQVSSAPASK